MYTEIHVFLALLVQERSYVGKGTPQGNMKRFHAKMKVNTYTVCEIGLFTEEEEELKMLEKKGFGNFTYTYVIVAVYFERVIGLETLEATKAMLCF